MKLDRPYAVEEIAIFLQAQIVWGKGTYITGINEIHKVVSGDLSFVDHPKYYQKCLNSPASVVLINKADVENSQNKTLLVSDDPFRDYNKLVQRFRPFRACLQHINETSTIGTNSIIQSGAVIGHHVSIGNNCLVFPNVVIYDHTIIGDNVVIHANTTIGADAFYMRRYPKGYEKMRSCGRVIIEDNVEIGANCTIDKGVSGDTIIGTGTKIDNQVHIGHGCVIGRNCLIAAQVGIAGKTIVKDEVTLWGQVGVSKSLTIGTGTTVLAQSGVAKSLPPNKTYFGSPATEARQKMKEIAALKQLPNLLKKVRTK